MPPHGLKKVLILGSGPIVIGQAAEFDYAGTQACKAMRLRPLRALPLGFGRASVIADRRSLLSPPNLLEGVA